jgi:hypothetical protein
MRVRLELVSEITPAEHYADDWPLRMAPDRYLKLHADGKHAEMARRIVAAAPPPSEES